MKRLLLFAYVTFLISPYVLLAQQAPSIEWARCYGGKGLERVGAIIQTFDGGYAFIGYTASNDGDVSLNHGSDDVWLVKLDFAGNVQWSKCFGGVGSDAATSIIQTSDGGYAISGSASSNDGDVTGNHGAGDAWVVKLDSVGIIEWQKCLGGSESEGSDCIIQSPNGGYIIAGVCNLDNGDVSGHHGTYYADVWVVSLSSKGDIQWQRCYGGQNPDIVTAIINTSDRGFAFCGYTQSNDGDVSGNHMGQFADLDMWVVKIDSVGKLEWQKCLGGSENDEAHSIIQSADGGYVIGGFTASNDGDLSGRSYTYPTDSWIVKLNSSGKIDWQRYFGARLGAENARSLIQTADGGYAFAGWRSLYPDSDSVDVWVVKLRNSGGIEWQKSLGGGYEEAANSIIQARDGGLIIAGYTWSLDGDVIGNHGGWDIWIIKLKPTGSAVATSTSTSAIFLTTYPNPATKKLTLGYDLEKAAADVVISISDVTGRRIEEHHADAQLAGHSEMTLDLGGYAAGTYYVTVSVGDLSETKSVEVVR